jgi:8-oxo-dGTP diphosphatase
VLVARRPPGPRATDGLWEFPGGKIEQGETPQACLERELHEEFGVEAACGKFLCASRHAYPDFDIELLAFEVEGGGGDWEPREHDAVDWVPVGDLLSVALAPADVPIAELLERTDS